MQANRPYRLDDNLVYVWVKYIVFLGFELTLRRSEFINVRFGYFNRIFGSKA